MNRIENSTRAGSESRPMIGPTTNPTNRSIPVQSPPPTTWQKTSPQRSLRAIATTTPTSRSATIGRPLTGMIWNGRRSCGSAPGLASAATAIAAGV